MNNETEVLNGVSENEEQEAATPETVDILDRMMEGATAEDLLVEGFLTDKEYHEMKMAEQRSLKAREKADKELKVVTKKQPPLLVLDSLKPLGLAYRYTTIICQNCGGEHRHLTQILTKHRQKDVTMYRPISSMADIAELMELPPEIQEATMAVFNCESCISGFAQQNLLTILVSMFPEEEPIQKKVAETQFAEAKKKQNPLEGIDLSHL